MRQLLYFMVGVAVVACGGGGSDTAGSDVNLVRASPGNLVIRWEANRETAVNQAGGGYRVYRGLTSGFDVATATMVDVPYQGGALAPTQTVLNFTPGTYYVKVTAYSALNPAGSAASPVTEIVVASP